MSERLTHLDAEGSARMVDVGAKGESERRAVAEARLAMSPTAAGAVERGDGPKGEVLGTARLAGIGAAKRAGELIPLAHPCRSPSSTCREASMRLRARSCCGRRPAPWRGPGSRWRP